MLHEGYRKKIKYSSNRVAGKDKYRSNKVADKYRSNRVTGKVSSNRVEGS
jgi:hypothetical protein